MRILGIIPARANSQRLPGKHLMPCGGRPLIEWTIDAADRSRALSAVLISTNDKDILDQYGGKARPDKLSGPNVSSEEVVQSIIGTGSEWDAICLLQPTSPLRTADDIDHAIHMLYANYWADAVVSYSPVRDFYGLHTNGAIYLTRTEIIERGSFFGDRWLPYVMPAERSVDVDTQQDMERADSYLQTLVT